MKIAKVKSIEGIDKFIETVSKKMAVRTLKFEKFGGGWMPTFPENDIDEEHAYNSIKKTVSVKIAGVDPILALEALDERIEDIVADQIAEIAGVMPNKTYTTGIFHVGEAFTNERGNGVSYSKRVVLKVINTEGKVL